MAGNRRAASNSCEPRELPMIPGKLLQAMLAQKPSAVIGQVLLKTES